MMKRTTYSSNQLMIPFEEIIENLGVPANYDFSKLKKIFLPNNPLTEYPLFLPSKTKAVNNSRIRFRYLFENKNMNLAPTIQMNDLLYKCNDFTIKADMDYGLPDEFDGQVFDCLIMLISKEYVERTKVYKGYRIDETVIMNELAGQNGYVIGGTLYNRIKFSLNRMFHTTYQIHQERRDENGGYNYLDILYRLIDGIYRKGSRYKDIEGKEVQLDHTIVLPHSAILSSIEEKKYYIISNEKRYALKRYLSKVIYDKLHLVVYAQIHAMAKDMFIAQKFNSHPFFVIGYFKFCDKIGISPLSEKEMRPAMIKRQLGDYINELINQDILLDLEVDKTKKIDKSFNLIFIFKWEFVDRVYAMANKSMDIQGINDISKEQIETYFKKMESQINSVPIKNKIKGIK